MIKILFFIFFLVSCSTFSVKKFHFPSTFFAEQVLEFDFNGKHYLVSQLNHSNERTTLVIIDPITGSVLFEANGNEKGYSVKSHLKKNKGLSRDVLLSIIKSIRYLYNQDTLSTNQWINDSYGGMYLFRNIEGDDQCQFPKYIFFKRSKPNLELKITSSSWSCE